MAEMADTKKRSHGPFLGTAWWLLVVGLVALVACLVDSTVHNFVLGFRAAVALFGYLIMQVGLWLKNTYW